jgi:NAD/NADP transhydrogenase beta subunit
MMLRVPVLKPHIQSATRRSSFLDSLSAATLWIVPGYGMAASGAQIGVNIQTAGKLLAASLV